MSPNLPAPPDPFRHPDTDFARALIKRAMRQQALPHSWPYGILFLVDREGLPHQVLTRPGYIDPVARKSAVEKKPIWQVGPPEESDWLMHRIREALRGDPSYNSRSLEFGGRRINAKVRMFDLGKGLVACLTKSWWENAAHSVNPPIEFDALSRYYLSKPKLELSEPDVVWWVQNTGLIINQRSHVIVTSPFAVARGQLMHLGELCHADFAQRLMNAVYEGFHTGQKRSFAMEEYLENLRIVYVYTIYPLSTVWSIEPAIAMVTKTWISSTILDSQKVYPVRWEATQVS